MKLDISSRSMTTSFQSLFDDSPHFSVRHAMVTSNHVMVNQARVGKWKKPLTRSKLLDRIAHNHAMSMASRNAVYNLCDSSVQLQQKLKSDGEAGETVHCGTSIQQIQEKIEKSKDYQNSREEIFSDKYNEFGMGSAIGRDGQIYMCQLFRFHDLNNTM